MPREQKALWKGSVISIHITSATEQPMRSVEEVHAVPGRGLEGDRYFLDTGRFSKYFGPNYEVTFIERETIDALNREYQDLNLTAAESRRNIETWGVPLNHLVGRAFRIGDVVIYGRLLAEPCLYLAKLTHHNVLAGLIHRGGLRAQILTEGIIRVGDPIEEVFGVEVPAVKAHQKVVEH